tara:strand:- start:239 stop:748 length:510 start_codon:yes stop_codon:yes gene_type:complete
MPDGSKATLALAVMGLLAGCAGDNPDNIPEYGQWEMVRALDSMTIDGMMFARGDIPPEMLAMEGTETRCGEPTYTDRAWQAKDVRNRTKGMCEVETYESTGTSASLTGQCEIAGPDGTYRPKMTGNSTIGAQSTRDVVIMEGTFTVANDSSPHVLKVIAIQESTRIGDC